MRSPPGYGLNLKADSRSPTLYLIRNMKTARGLWSRAEKGVEDRLLWSPVYTQEQPGMAVLQQKRYFSIMNMQDV